MAHPRSQGPSALALGSASTPAGAPAVHTLPHARLHIHRRVALLLQQRLQPLLLNLVLRGGAGQARWRAGRGCSPKRLHRLTALPTARQQPHALPVVRRGPGTRTQPGSTHLQLLKDALHGARPRRDAPRALLQACAAAMHASVGLGERGGGNATPLQQATAAGVQGEPRGSHP